MHSPIRFAFVLLYLVVAVAGAQSTQPADDFADVGKVPDPAPGDRWWDWAKGHHWSTSAIEAITRDKVLLGGREYKQVFEVYTEPAYPMFITTDSVLNGYNVLLEESVRRIESANAKRLSKILQDILKNLATADARITGNAALARSAKERAQITVAVAVSLLDDQPPALDPALAGIVAGEVKKVREGTAVEKPSWLGKPTPDLVAIDYSRFTPRGFYTQSPRLENYFRAVAWLQAIPFRVQEDDEMLAAVMIGIAAAPSQMSIRLLSDCYDQLLGPADNPDLPDIIDSLPSDPAGKIDLTGGQLGKLRADLLRNSRARQHVPVINDELKLPPEGDPAVTFRIFPARRTPDAVFFEHLMRNSPKPLPSGLDIAASLGSPYARQVLPKPLPAYEPLIDPQLRGLGPLYVDYLNCLRSLLDPPDKDAPKFLSSPIWQAKTCQTIAAGWAQARHTWQLQAKENMEVLGEFLGPAGFVEPVPTFYTRMADLCDRTGSLLRDAGVGVADYSELAGQAHRLIALVQQNDIGPDGKARPHQLTDQELSSVVEALCLVAGDKFDMHNQNLRSQLPAIEKLAAGLDRDVALDDAQAAIIRALGSDSDLPTLWHTLAELCLRLDALSQKQLRGADFSDDDNAFIRSYGGQLGNVMLYGANSWEIPKDDAPRIADVYRNPNIGQYLEVGIGRPRSLYILYPYHGGEVLCEGAVMPYYEFPHATPMTDAAWKDMLDSKTPPKPMFPIKQP